MSGDCEEIAFLVCFCDSSLDYYLDFCSALSVHNCSSSGTLIPLPNELEFFFLGFNKRAIEVGDLFFFSFPI